MLHICFCWDLFAFNMCDSIVKLTDYLLCIMWEKTGVHIFSGDLEHRAGPELDRTVYTHT